MNLTSCLKEHKYAAWLIIFWVTGVLVLAACYWILHQPVKQRLAIVQNQYTDSRDMLVIANLASREDVQQRQQKQLENARQKMDQFSVPQDNTTGLVFEIGKIANELSLAEFSSKHQTARKVPTLNKDAEVSEAWLEVEFKSSFRQFAEFVNRLEWQTPAVFIEQITFRRNEDDQRQHNIKLELSFLVKQRPNQSVAQATVMTGENKTVNNVSVEN